ncbi:MAG: RNA polymerase sigma factor RpoE [Thiothrix sp.]|nr:MAG: RNA polymerase sigma factor RpoE [Thiothrix sp.]
MGSGATSKEYTDAELVKRVKSGDSEAFNLLVLKYQNKIIHLVSRYVKDTHAAQDVAQEAFIKAYRGLARFRGESAFYTWLYRIAINTAKNYIVSEKRRVPEFEVDAYEAEQFGENQALKEIASPESVLLSEEIKQQIVVTIRGLPDDLREAIILREVEGLSYEDIAESMSCPIGTVRSRIFRAREAIGKVLDTLLN